jgi:hypothetical protein
MSTGNVTCRLGTLQTAQLTPGGSGRNVQSVTGNVECFYLKNYISIHRIKIEIRYKSAKVQSCLFCVLCFEADAERVFNFVLRNVLEGMVRTDCG